MTYWYHIFRWILITCMLSVFRMSVLLLCKHLGEPYILCQISITHRNSVKTYWYIFRWSLIFKMFSMSVLLLCRPRCFAFQKKISNSALNKVQNFTLVGVSFFVVEQDFSAKSSANHPVLSSVNPANQIWTGSTARFATNAPLPAPVIWCLL